MSRGKDRAARAKGAASGDGRACFARRGAEQERTPRRARTFQPGSTDGKLVVQFGRVDVGGPWCLTAITRDDHAALLGRIRGFESMTVAEAFTASGEPGKDYDVAGLPNEAAHERLQELELDDETRISRLRVSGTGRLYGFRREERFYALWWDPRHEVWPSPKKHT